MPYSLEQIENVITAVATRKNYGVGDGPHASVWRWEVNDLSIFSDELQKSIQERRVLRENAAKGLASAFDILSSEEKELIQSSSTKIDRDVLSKVIYIFCDPFQNSIFHRHEFKRSS